MLSSSIKLVVSVPVVGFISALKREAFSLTFRKTAYRWITERYERTSTRSPNRPVMGLKESHVELIGGQKC